MSYGVGAALQAAVFGALTSDATLAGLVGSAIYDVVPSGTVPTLYVSLGPEEVRDRSDKTGRGANHVFTVSVVTEVPGFQAAKEVAAAVSDALVDAPLVLSRGVLVSLSFERARAFRERDGARRRIDLRFAARVEDN